MANIKISQLPTAVTPLTGTELVPLVHTATTVKATVTDVVSQVLVGQALYPRTAAETAAGVTPTNYYYAPGDVRRYGGTGGNITTALVAALSVGIDVYIPEGSYTFSGGQLTMATSGQKLTGAGRDQTVLTRASNGVGLNIAANYVVVSDLSIHNDSGSTYTGELIYGTGSRQGVVLERVNSFRCLTSNIRYEEFGHFIIRDCYIDNAPAAAGTPNVHIGQSGLGTYAGLYGVIDACRLQPSGNPVRFDAMGGCKIVNSQFGGWDNNVATGSSTVNAVIGNRITGTVSIEGSGHTLVGNQIGAYAVTFESGSSGSWYAANTRDTSSTLTNNGTTNVLLDTDANGLPYFNRNLRVNNNVGIRFYDSAGTNYAFIGETTADNLSITNNSGAIQLNASNFIYQLASLPTSSAGLPAGSLWNSLGVVNIV